MAGKDSLLGSTGDAAESSEQLEQLETSYSHSRELESKSEMFRDSPGYPVMSQAMVRK
jgi:hypothetical protein